MPEAARGHLNAAKATVIYIYARMPAANRVMKQDRRFACQGPRVSDGSRAGWCDLPPNVYDPPLYDRFIPV
jgi:hypothetical protein